MTKDHTLIVGKRCLVLTCTCNFDLLLSFISILILPQVDNIYWLFLHYQFILHSDDQP